MTCRSVRVSDHGVSLIFQIRARADVAAITAWLAERDRRFAERWRDDLLDDVLEKLENDPLRHPVSEELANHGLELREPLHGKRSHVYRVFFSVCGDTVYMHRIRHAAQDRLEPGGL